MISYIPPILCYSVLKAITGFFLLAILEGIRPTINPSIIVSALNILVISFFYVTMALNIPIFFVISNTDMYVIIAIIIEDTISDIATRNKYITNNINYFTN